ncbi:dTDP-glucose 4,6-dehydratase [Priestia endophytica]|uniref:dTDP-glucose 4,6-dehydratase n=1 Tax=Priestia endophytica TaxID=135735 RepID=UPI00203FF961|nr:dTDP-glucose 4,6-dehydratase [Priestia endophytica]MCM3541125.1 dTDP-glucose 4,6-dehydratase [Priestia endophytica]
MNKKVLITGGAGFIGSNFIRHLLKTKNYDITNIDAMTYAGNEESIKEFSNYSNYLFIKADITNNRELDKVFSDHYDIIVNFAAETHVDRSIQNASSFIHTNVIGTHNLLQKILEEKAGKMIQISTDEVYGSLELNENPFTETNPLSPNNPYSASKASADLLVRSFYKTYKAPIIITRCSNNYGPYQHPEKLIPKIIYHALNNLEIPIYGNGTNIRDWLFVEDHCRAIHTVMERGLSGEIYNIGSNNERTNLGVAQIILKILGKSEELITFVADRKGHDYRYAINWNKLNDKLGWTPSISFEDGIRKTLEWYMNHYQWIEKSIKTGDIT